MEEVAEQVEVTEDAKEQVSEEQSVETEEVQAEEEVEAADEVVEADGASDSLVRMLLPFASMALTVLVGVLSWYMMRHRMPRKAAVKGITTSIMLDWDITNVYDYVSTPDFRTEWHMAAVEVNGPAIDHSAVTGARPDLATQAASCAACAPSSPPLPTVAPAHVPTVHSLC